ncbi:DUF2789 domain-containing protein [Thiomicrorhabdus hydrogeniphila]
MESQSHDLTALFSQLGLANSEQDIEAFIRLHSPLDSKTLLHQAIFWTHSQSQFLKEAVDDDADWADVVNHLDTLLRG